ncbi:hypothetical protein EDB19DRAFT_1828395 [Suillus lakei]|nr:hypothetical protein EDB19DRAFT_1828395 [Suillus lakei]
MVVLAAGAILTVTLTLASSFDPSFLEVTGPSATIRSIASNPGFAFAHEAPIYVPDLNAVFFTSNDGGPLGYNGWYNNSVVSMINMTEVDMALASTIGDVNIQVQTLNLPDTIQMADSSTRSTDIKILPGTDIMFFTDPTEPGFLSYGWLNGFRPEPMLPSQVYRLDPSTGQVCASEWYRIHPRRQKCIYIKFRYRISTDTGISGGFLGTNQTLPATTYQFDVDPQTQTFTNRRVFAYSESGCGEGTHVWNAEGTLIGKFYLNSTTAQMIFTKSGLVILDEEAIYLANIQAQGLNLATL